MGWQLLQRALVHSYLHYITSLVKIRIRSAQQAMLFLFIMHTSNWSELVCDSLNWPQPTKVDADVMHQALLLEW